VPPILSPAGKYIHDSIAFSPLKVDLIVNVGYLCTIPFFSKQD
jgi:hypothetical protein